MTEVKLEPGGTAVVHLFRVANSRLKMKLDFGSVTEDKKEFGDINNYTLSSNSEKKKTTYCLESPNVKKVKTPY